LFSFRLGIRYVLAATAQVTDVGVGSGPPKAARFEGSLLCFPSTAALQGGAGLSHRVQGAAVVVGGPNCHEDLSSPSPGATGPRPVPKALRGGRTRAARAASGLRGHEFSTLIFSRSNSSAIWCPRPLQAGRSIFSTSPVSNPRIRTEHGLCEASWVEDSLRRRSLSRRGNSKAREDE